MFEQCSISGFYRESEGFYFNRAAVPDLDLKDVSVCGSRSPGVGGGCAVVFEDVPLAVRSLCHNGNNALFIKNITKRVTLQHFYPIHLGAHIVFSVF